MKDLGRTIADNRKRNGMGQAALAEAMRAFGFAPSVASVSSWEKNVSVPSAAQFLAICSILHISDIYSEFIDDHGGSFAGLNAMGRLKAQEYIALLTVSPEYRAEQQEADVPQSVHTGQTEQKEHTAAPAVTDITALRSLRLYNLPASAGYGEFLDSYDYTVVQTDKAPKAADFGIRIRGNSMEPRYTDGQTVWVKKCDTLRSGDIGIFFLDGNAYCKQYSMDSHGVRLVSLNPDYAPIEITEDSNLIPFGKVLN